MLNSRHLKLRAAHHPGRNSLMDYYARYVAQITSSLLACRGEKRSQTTAVQLQDVARLPHRAYLASVSPRQELIWGPVPTLLGNLSTVS